MTNRLRRTILIRVREERNSAEYVRSRRGLTLRWPDRARAVCNVHLDTGRAEAQGNPMGYRGVQPCKGQPVGKLSLTCPLVQVRISHQIGESVQIWAIRPRCFFSPF